MAMRKTRLVSLGAMLLALAFLTYFSLQAHATTSTLNKKADGDYHASVAATDTVKILFSGYANHLDVAAVTNDVTVWWVTNEDHTAVSDAMTVEAADVKSWDNIRIYGVWFSGDGGASAVTSYWQRNRY